MKPNSLRALASLFALVLLLSGCAKLPTNGEVKVGSDIQSGLTADYLYYSPSGPIDGASQADIINGFLNAATGPQGDYQVAREFLAGALAAEWNPSNELLIAEARPEVQLIGTTGARIRLNAMARIDDTGRYHDLGNGVERALYYEFINQDGQWRISSAPNATVLVRPVFDVLFKSYSLYFYDEQNRYLVPDLRWFATRVSTSTRLVSALLAGPSDWLSGSVQNSFPSKTKLALDSVTVENGTAIVDLDSTANHATVIERQRMLAQLTATLTQLANVFDVEIRIDHISQNIANLPYEVSLANNPDPIVLTGDGFKVLSSSASPMVRASDAAVAWGATDFAINNQQTLLALQSSKGIGLHKLTGNDAKTLLVDGRPNLLAPSIDPQGYIWTLGAAEDSGLSAFDSTGAQDFSWLGWLAGKKHLAFAVSREGGRVAVLVQNGKQNQIFVAAITRNAKGAPVAISNPIQIGQSQQIVRSLSWIDDTSVGTIARNADGLTNPIYLQIDGEIKKLTFVPNAISVVANGLYSSAYVLDSSRNLKVLRSMTWLDSASDIHAIHFAG